MPSESVAPTALRKDNGLRDDGKAKNSLELNEHEGIRTPDPQNRNLMLYPTELRALGQARL